MMVGLLPEIDDAMWHEIEKAEDGATRAVFYYIHGVSEGTRWPKPALDRSIFRDMFAEVRLMLGDRIGGLKVHRGAKDQVNIDWNHFGYYRILREGDGEKTEVFHLPPGKKADIREKHIKGTGFAIHANWSETKASVRYGKLKQSILEFFDERSVSEVTRRVGDLGKLMDVAKQVADMRLQQKPSEEVIPEQHVDPESKAWFPGRHWQAPRRRRARTRSPSRAAAAALRRSSRPIRPRCRKRRSRPLQRGGRRSKLVERFASLASVSVGPPNVGRAL